MGIRSAWVWGLVFGVPLLVAGCSSAAPGDSSSPSGNDDGSQAHTVPSDEAPPEEFWTEERLRSATPLPMPVEPGESYQLLDIRDDLTDLQRVRWIDWESREDGRIIRVLLSAGPRACFAATAEVSETDSTVSIDVSVGTIPGTGDCTTNVHPSIAEVPLHAPLGGRNVVQANS